ncbi:MAG TPA: nucleotide exchange factor GrpE [Usitatibacter sp.]|nr:nucleotide exchange factor GrpE [Usitatibacter sp.]
MTDADLAGAGGAAPAQRPPAGEDSPETGSDPRYAELEAQLAEARAEAERTREDWLRAKAETDNVRRRAQEDVAKAHRFGQENFANALLPVKDSLDAALAVENASVESFKEGVELTARQLVAAFEKHAIREVVPQGEKFDPHRHQAISQVESDQEPGTVVSVLQKGYMLHDRVLRPALVIVSKAPSADS